MNHNNTAETKPDLNWAYDPTFFRNKSLSLDGQWKIYSDVEEINGKFINVPYCVESRLSGVGYKGFVKYLRYEREFVLTEKAESERVFIHFGAVDHECRLFINDKLVGGHVGGYTHFKFDITDFVNVGKNFIKLEVYDDVKDNIASGKQSEKERSFGCFYTRTTGIWQSVRLEFVPNNYIDGFEFDPDAEKCRVTVRVRTKGEGPLSAEVRFDGRIVGEGSTHCTGECVFTVVLKEKHLWECGNGRLYDVTLKFGGDVVQSYFGLRSVRYDGYRFLLNGKSVFQRLVLDQGYYPDGIYTAPSREAMEKDVDNVVKLGFNGVRLHQKVFDPYYLYLCDKKGLMVWGEYPSWGIDYSNTAALSAFIGEWTEAVREQYNHPSIVLWCPLNETWVFGKEERPRDVRFVNEVYKATKALDKTRPCVDVSGGFHGENTDLYDFHCYGSPDELSTYIRRLDEDDILNVPLLYAEGEPYRYKKGLPVAVSEFGGIAFDIGTDCACRKESESGAVINENKWGYGKSEDSFGSFFDRYKRLVEVIYSSPKISGSCYTQLYDIEQEENGLLRYDRSAKFTQGQMDIIARCNKIPAKIEEE